MDAKEFLKQKGISNNDFMDSGVADLIETLLTEYQDLQLQQGGVMCCVDYVEGITINKVYQVVGFTNDKQMYVINNDYDVYSCYGVDLFKHST